MKKKVLMVGSSVSVKGGMTTVMEGFLKNDFKKYKLYYIPTHIEKSRLNQIIFFFIAIIKIILILITKNVSIVHVHFSERGSFIRKNLVINICKMFNKKTIIHMHGAEFKEFYNNSSANRKNKIAKFLRRADKVIVLGDSWSKFVRDIDENIKIEIMPNFVTCTKDIVVNNSNEINIVFLAVLIKRKGIYDLIEAINIILKNKKLKKYKINVIVAGTGAEEQNMKEIVDELGINKNFYFKGWVENKEKEEILKKGQIFVLPSYNEGLPVSILEAMSFGLPIITTNVGSIEDAVKDGFNGTIISPGDVQMLAKSIIDLIENKELWDMYSINNKSLVEQKYCKNRYFKKLEDVYSRI